MSDDEVYLSDGSVSGDEETEFDPGQTGSVASATAKHAPILTDHAAHLEAHDPNEPEQHQRMTKYEYARLKGVRTEQLQRGAIPFVAYTDSDDATSIYRREFIQGCLPFKIERKLPDGRSVFYRVRDFSRRDAAEYD